MSNTIKVALAAYGLSGSVFHAPLIHAHTGLHLYAVLQRSASSAKERYPYTKIVSSYDQLLSDPDIDLIVVNTPEYLHYEMAKQAMLAGKHVVVEKAFTPTSLEAEELIKVSIDQNKLLSVFQNCRWHSDFVTIKHLLSRKLLGEVVSFEAHFDRYRPEVQGSSWKEEEKPGTGVLYNLGSHMIDQALQLFGWPEKVQADIVTQRSDGKVDDFFDLKLYYSGLTVNLKSSYLVRSEGPRYIIHGTKGSFIKNGIDQQEALLKAGKSPLEDGWGAENAKWWGEINTDFQGIHIEGKVESLRASYLEYYQNIYEALKLGKKLAVKADQALQVIQIIEAAYQSQRKGRMITLSGSK
ncbi:Gfo/Idh/MocA family oxidoreductase [Porifericola rhodea]|uniref:Gfo/Idh/MocA family oxidoreductase n=1 Tax=Porifericola rhodea TaxID=930972 RepID=UPI00266631D3|nr:Gfo/Idh/MocA family oxidoreductase [Porifericola rhodea]WKN30855.1 Gfo/Idh/MocA family oxidoreductase [Porifericola rhodea]